MSFKVFDYPCCIIIFIVICNLIGRILPCKDVLKRRSSRARPRISDRDRGSRHNGERQSKPEGKYCPVCADEKTYEGRVRRVNLDIKKRQSGLNSSKGSERPSCRRKIEAALPLLLQAVELDNAGSLEAVDAYKAVAKLFDDALEILNNKPWKPTQVSVEAGLRNMRDTYKDRADLLLRDFQKRVLSMSH